MEEGEGVVGTPWVPSSAGANDATSNSNIHNNDNEKETSFVAADKNDNNIPNSTDYYYATATTIMAQGSFADPYAAISDACQENTVSIRSPDARFGLWWAANLLRDYEAHRPPLTMQMNTGDDADDAGNTDDNTGKDASVLQPISLSEPQRLAVLCRNHPFVRTMRGLAAAGLFLACAGEGYIMNSSSSNNNNSARTVAFVAVGNGLAILILWADVFLHRKLLPAKPTAYDLRWIRPVQVFGAALLLELAVRLCNMMVMANANASSSSSSTSSSASHHTHSLVLWTSAAKPLVLFYVSQRARDAARALRNVTKSLGRILAMELLLVLMFAALACRLYRNHAPAFRNLSTAWLALFVQSTTVSNPSVWMELYAESPSVALFFCAFVIISVFYMHSLVLSVVFSTYLQAAAKVHERAQKDREDALQLAFDSLRQVQEVEPRVISSKIPLGTVSASLMRETLRQLRPHYSNRKIDTLMEIMDPKKVGCLDFGNFKARIRPTLNASVRTSRPSSRAARLWEYLGLGIAGCNFAYVILATSVVHDSSVSDRVYYHRVQVVGTIIAVAAAFELVGRLGKLVRQTRRHHPSFDVLAVVAAAVSFVGILGILRSGADDEDGGDYSEDETTDSSSSDSNSNTPLDYLIMGRALDLLRLLRYVPTFRDIVWRSSDVAPALIGPGVLVATTLHLFVYVGMALWGGAVHVGRSSNYNSNLDDDLALAGGDDDAAATLATPSVSSWYYDLFNFNSYLEGVVTMFQVLVVNDWHMIAQVFLHKADRCARPWIVYSFFIAGNLVAVSIMLNVLTAFFVQTFVTKLDPVGQNKNSDDDDDDVDQDFSIRSSETAALRHVSSEANVAILAQQQQQQQQSKQHSATQNMMQGNNTDYFEFDIYEREGLDAIMQTVASPRVSGPQPPKTGEVTSPDMVDRYIHLLAAFQGIVPQLTDSMGYMVWDQTTGQQHTSNSTFAHLVQSVRPTEDVLSLVRRMHEELRLSQQTSIGRSYAHPSDPGFRLEILANLLQPPTLSLWVAQMVVGPPVL